MTSDNNQIKNITWQDIEPLILDEKYKEFFKNLDPETFKLILDESSSQKVVESVLKMLRDTDPKNATQEYANGLIEIMKKVITQITEKSLYRSFLMGASQITDKELLDLDIQIKPCDDQEDRKLIIPATSIEDYKNLIRNKLDSGFWNDFVGEDLIYFIFKMPDGEIKEFIYDEDDRLKIAELCSQLNHDPIEKTSDLLNYLAGNDFYKKTIDTYRNKISND